MRLQAIVLAFLTACLGFVIAAPLVIGSRATAQRTFELITACAAELPAFTSCEARLDCLVAWV
jgi:hypothetical protein